MKPRLARLVPPRWCFALAATAHVTFLFTMSASTSDPLGVRLPGPSANLLHIPASAVLGLLVLRAFVPLTAWDDPKAWPGLRTSAGRLSWSLVLAHGIFDEVHQFYVPGRTCSVLDLIMDAAGGAVVLLVPWRGSDGRPSGWRPAVWVALLGLAAGLVGWVGRPFPDRLLEGFLTFATAG